MSSEPAKCVQASGALGPCTGAGWEITESGQLKTGDMCLSQSGSFAGSEDIAAFAPVSATTSSDAAMHGAKMAVDSDTATFWQSAPGDARSQEFVIDFGGERKVASVEIEWEAPAVEYSIELSKNGKDWTPVFATDVNNPGDPWNQYWNGRIFDGDETSEWWSGSLSLNPEVDGMSSSLMWVMPGDTRVDSVTVVQKSGHESK